MKNIVLTMAFAILVAMISCSSQPANNNGEVADNAKTADKTNAKGTVKLTKEKFLAEVWDFENNPNEFVFKGDLPVLIDFYADWCGPCKATGPILEEIAKEYHGKIVIYKLNVDHERELAQGFGIQSIPSYLYIPSEGEPFMAQPGMKSKETFIQEIEDGLLNKAEI